MNELTFNVITFGCPVNQAESDALEEVMSGAGFSLNRDRAFINIINSCAVTQSAAREARRAVRQIKKNNPDAVVVLAGCYPQVDAEKLEKELPEADIIIGTTDKFELPRILLDWLNKKVTPPRNLVRVREENESFEEAAAVSPGRIRPVLKIQEGCDENCLYCVVRRARGKPRSLPPNRVMEITKGYLERGYREVILAGTHLGIYGREFPGWNLARIVEEISRLPYDFRLRLGYIEPMDVSPQLLEVMGSSSKVCRHLYLPLQSGSDRILRVMGRKYTAGDFANIVRRARELMPEISIWTDVIAGFPGEGEDDHRETISLIRELELSRIHVFPFSPRPGTPAFTMSGQVRPDVKKRRAREIAEIGRELAYRYHQKMTGKDLRVLVEKLEVTEDCTAAVGYSDTYIRVKATSSNLIKAGEFVRVRTCTAHWWGIDGTAGE